MIWKGVAIMEVATTHLGHLGIVAGFYNTLGMSDVIDAKIPKTRHYKVTHSDVILAMLLNGLGFVGRRLYLFPSYYENCPVERLIGEGITPSNLNEFAIGRTLDAIYEYGPTELFNEIMLNIMSRMDLGTQLIHADTTSFSVQGAYEGEDGGNAIEITLGHSKDGRMDLNQFIMSLVSNQNGIPLFVQAHSGNASDKKTIIETIHKVRNGLSFDTDTYYVADSAVYTYDNIQRLGEKMLWITRVPATVGEAKELLDADLEMVPCQDTRYTFYSTRSTYGEIEQIWVVFQSQPMKKRMEKTFDKKLKKEAKTAQRSLGRLRRREFACEADAKKEAELWIADHPYFRFTDLIVELVFRRAGKKRGRPKKDEVLLTVYTIKAEIELDAEIVHEARDKLGRFILASSDTEIDPEVLL